MTAAENLEVNDKVMKITNTKAGRDYQLAPGTQIEIERPNLFFNEWGEQTTPIELPDTDINRELCGYPDMLGNVLRPQADIECTVQDGDFFQPARQAILGAKRKESITTTLYLNEGSFLAKVDETLVSDVFGDETVPGVSSVEEAIEFCRKLAKGTSTYQDQFGIFPVLLASDETDEDGNTVYKWLNRYGVERSDGIWLDNTYYTQSESDFYNAVERTETSGEDTIELGIGYYISPYLKANYLLKRILQHFGYELEENFFTQTAPFTNMVFVNNCCDALVNGVIRYSDLVPECTCGQILDVFRKKFCCEFITDEAARTVKIVLFNEAIDGDTSAILTPYLTAQLQVEPPEAYRRITLKSEEATESDLDSDNPETLEGMVLSYKYVGYNKKNGSYERIGYMIGKPGRLQSNTIREQISDSTIGYDTGESMEAEEITVPDCIAALRDSKTTIPNSRRQATVYMLYIGKGKYSNSSLSVEGVETESDVETRSEDEPTKAILAFALHLNGVPIGTTASYIDGGNQLVELDYSLHYIGPDGIYEKFWRRMDELYRNSLMNVTAELKLPDHLKSSLSSCLPVVINGQRLLPNVLHYTLGGDEQSIESTFLTTRSYEPVSVAKEAVDYDIYGSSGYIWTVHCTEKEITKDEYESSAAKGVIKIFPEEPSEKYADGQKHYIRASSVAYTTNTVHGYYRIEAWLTCSKRNE